MCFDSIHTKNKMNHDIEMEYEPTQAQPLDLEKLKANVGDDRLDSGYKSRELEPDCKSGCEPITDKFQKDLSINSQCSSEERRVSVAEGYSSESLKSGDLDSSGSWKPSENTPSISEVTERETETNDNIDTIDPYVEEVFTQDEDGDTDLHTAIINYLWQFAIHLISLVKSPDWLNIKNTCQQTPLHLAVLTKQPLLVRKLMAAGAQVDVPDRNGNTPLHLAAREGYTLIAKALLEPITQAEQDEVEYEIPYVKIPQNLEARNYNGQVSLHLAAEDNHQDILEVLLSKRAEINQRDGKRGRTILHYAAESGKLSLLQFLLQYGSLDINASTYGGQTPIMLAKGRGHNSIIQVLKSARAQYDSCDESVEDEEMKPAAKMISICEPQWQKDELLRRQAAADSTLPNPTPMSAAQSGPENDNSDNTTVIPTQSVVSSAPPVSNQENLSCESTLLLIPAIPSPRRTSDISAPISTVLNQTTSYQQSSGTLEPASAVFNPPRAESPLPPIQYSHRSTANLSAPISAALYQTASYQQSSGTLEPISAVFNPPRVENPITAMPRRTSNLSAPISTALNQTTSYMYQTSGTLEPTSAVFNPPRVDSPLTALNQTTSYQQSPGSLQPAPAVFNPPQTESPLPPIQYSDRRTSNLSAPVSTALYQTASDQQSSGTLEPTSAVFNPPHIEKPLTAMPRRTSNLVAPVNTGGDQLMGEALSTPMLIHQTMTLMNEAEGPVSQVPFTATLATACEPRRLPDLTEFDCYLNLDSPELRPTNVIRQVFDGEFTDIFPIPNVTDRKVSIAWDRKLDAVNRKRINRKLASLARQQQEITRMLSFIIQNMNTSASCPLQQTSQPDASFDTNAIPPVTMSASLREKQTSTLETAASVDESFSDIPAQCRLSTEELAKLKASAHSIGHFAANLARRLFPELWGSDCLRLKYSFNGVKYGKQELDRQRKSYIQRYVLYFYPNLHEYKQYKLNVIDPINEALRRPVKTNEKK